MKCSDEKPPTAEELQNELNELLENVRVLQQLRQQFLHVNNNEMFCGTENERVNLHQLFKWTRSGNLAKCAFCGLKINRSARQKCWHNWNIMRISSDHCTENGLRSFGLYPQHNLAKENICPKTSPKRVGDDYNFKNKRLFKKVHRKGINHFKCFFDDSIRLIPDGNVNDKFINDNNSAHRNQHSFGTSRFSAQLFMGFLTLRKANIMATIMETAGATLVGYNVVDTVRKGIVEIELYTDAPQNLLVGQVAILGGCACWLMLATVFRLPISSTHSIVGATLGFTLLMKGNAGIHWSMVLKIVISWVVSPVLSGTISTIIYMIIDFAVLRRKNPFVCGLRIMPVFYFLCFTFYTFMVVFEGSRVLHLEQIPLWLALLISVGVGLCAMLIYLFILRPKLIIWAKGGKKKECNSSSNLPVDRSQPFNCSPRGVLDWFIPRRERKEDADTLRLFSIVQIVTGCFAGFSHGASDVSHTIAPLVAMLDIYNSQNVLQQGDTPLWMMFYGVSGTCFGFWALGHRVMKTVGKKITEINPCNGFAIEFGMAITVLCASKIGIPISSTHCLIGSVMFVGLIKSGEGVDWRVLTNVAMSWLLTLPLSALFSAFIMPNDFVV
uniref:Phosphate transporter n=1 Tax=Globodera rostochiensis TaxID=31243 RepID=A0A914GRF4_GLORO